MHAAYDTRQARLNSFNTQPLSKTASGLCHLILYFSMCTATALDISPGLSNTPGHSAWHVQRGIFVQSQTMPSDVYDPCPAQSQPDVKHQSILFLACFQLVLNSGWAGCRASTPHILTSHLVPTWCFASVKHRNYAADVESLKFDMLMVKYFIPSLLKYALPRLLRVHVSSVPDPLVSCITDA